MPKGALFGWRTGFVYPGRTGEQLEDGRTFDLVDVVAVANNMVFERRQKLGT